MHTNCPWTSIYFPLFIRAVPLISLSTEFTELATKPLSDLLISLDQTLNPVSTSLLSFSQLRDALLDMGPLDLDHIKKVLIVFPGGYMEISVLHSRPLLVIFSIFVFFFTLLCTNLFSDFPLEIHIDSLGSSTLIITAIVYFRSFTLFLRLMKLRASSGGHPMERESVTVLTFS